MRGCIHGYKICSSAGLKEDFSFLGVCGWGPRPIFDKILNRGGGGAEQILCIRIFDIPNNPVIKYFLNLSDKIY